MTTTTHDIGLPARWQDFWALTKPRVMSLVVFTALCGLLAAPGSIHPVIAFTAILCIATGAGASGALNQWYEAELDAKMQRTASRPLPAGRMDKTSALHFGIGLAAFSVGIMGVAVGWLAAGILAFSILFYAVIYTMWLKPNTPQNIVIGGAAGAFPPVIGWAAVTGDITILPILMFSIIFFWTPPHFWALALYRNDDYRRAGIPMLPVVAGERATKWHMLAYTILLLPLAVTPYFMGFAGMAYLIGAAVLGIMFVGCAIRVLRDKTHNSAKQMFGFSIFYLFALFGLLLAEHLVQRVMA